MVLKPFMFCFPHGAILYSTLDSKKKVAVDRISFLVPLEDGLVNTRKMNEYIQYKYIKTKKTLMHSTPCPSFYYVHQRHSSMGNRKGGQEKKNNLGVGRSISTLLFPLSGYSDKFQSIYH